MVIGPLSVSITACIPPELLAPAGTLGLPGGLAGLPGFEELHAALHKVIDRAATPDLVPPEALLLQPSEERRRSGSHYTPRSLTAPIVRTTLRPVLERLAKDAGGTPQPEAVLDLKVCDPAVGSGHFLVAAGHRIARRLASIRTGDEEPSPEATRTALRDVVSHCLYGIDVNPMAVDGPALVNRMR